MNPPWTPRDPDAPSELLVDAYVAGEATEAERLAIEAWCARDPTFAAVVDARRRGFDALPDANPRAMEARILQAIDARAPAAHPRRTRRAPGWPGGFWGGVGVTIAAAAAVLVAIALPTTGVDPLLEPGLRMKGSLGLRVFVDRNGEVSEAFSGDPFAAGDRVRFRPDGVTESGHILVVGVEADGRLFGYAPVGRVRSIATDALEADGSVAGSARLDASHGEEWAHLVWCAEPFELGQLRADARGRLRAPDGCVVSSFSIVKP